MSKAYSYIRFSTPAQSTGDSLRRQMTRGERFAAKHGLTIVESYRDLGLSAFKGIHRIKGALAQFLALVEAGEIDRGSVLIVENLDRLTREDVLEAVALFLRIINVGVAVATLSDDMIYSRETILEHPEYLNTSISQFIRANKESERKGEMLAEVWEQKRADLIANPRRKFTRQGPRWLDLIPDDPAGDPLVGEWKENANVRILQRLFTLALIYGRHPLAQMLNDENLAPFRHGDGWNPSTVHTLLTDRRVLGEFQPMKKIRGKRVPVGDPIKGYFPQVIDDQTFYRVQAAIEERWTGAQPGSKVKVHNLFRSLGRCACGGAMEYRDKRSKWSPGEKHRYLVCARFHRGMKDCTNGDRYIYADTESMILKWVSDIKISDEDSNRGGVAALKLAGKMAERDELKRLMVAANDRAEREAEPAMREDWERRARAHAAKLPIVHKEISALEIEANAAKRTVVDERRAAVRGLVAQLETADEAGEQRVRAKLATAVREAIERVTFKKDEHVTVTLRGASKSYYFQYGQHIGWHDASDWPEDERRAFAEQSARLTYA